MDRTRDGEIMGEAKRESTGWHETSHGIGVWTRRMREPLYAVIHRVPDRDSPGLLHIAGKRLIERQIDWLLMCGCDGVVVETSEDAGGRAIARWVDAHHGDGSDVLVVSTAAPARLGPREVARRGGIGAARSVLAIPADFLGNADLSCMATVRNGYGVVAFFEPPPALARTFGGSTVRLVRAPIGTGFRGQPTAARGAGWGARVQSAAQAAEMSAAVWRGEVPGISGKWDVMRVA